MKRIVALSLCLILLLGGTGAFAAQLATTAAFIAALEEQGITYSYFGANDDGDDIMNVVFSGDNLDEIVVSIFVDSELQDVNMFVWWDFTEFKPEQRAKVLDACNTANNEYRYVRFYVEESHNFVTAALNYWLSDVAAGGEAMVDMLYQLVGVVDECYQYFAPLMADDKTNAG